ncbi:dihydroorotase family protein [Patescibacteria group bacterium]
MSSLLINNVRIYNRDEQIDCLVVDGKIKQLEPKIDKRKAEKVIDANGLTMIPGGIDIHVHFRVPGNEEKEDWKTGSAAALAGGITTVMDMPNNSPSIITAALLKKKIALAKKDSKIDFGCYIAITKDNLLEIEAAKLIACGVKVYYGSTTGDILMNDLDTLRALFELDLPIPILIHAEDENMIEFNRAELKDYDGVDIHEKIRSREAAIKALETIIPLVQETTGHAHITHISTADELELMKQAKDDGINITCDTAPHYLAFTEEDVAKKGHLLKVNPPIRTQADVDALWAGLADGSIDVVASDHAPHLLKEKQIENYNDVPSGLPGVQTILPFLLDNISDEFSLDRLVEVISSRPADMFKLENKGKIDIGATADLVLFDDSKPTKITNKAMKSKCGWTPWDKQTFATSIEYVIKGGKVSFSL